MTRAFSVRFGFGLLLLGTLCVIAEPAQAGPFRRGGRGGCCGGGGGYASSGGCGGGYGMPMNYGGSSCCGGGMAYGGATYQPMGMAYGSSSCCGSGGMAYGGYGTMPGGYGSNVYGTPMYSQGGMVYGTPGTYPTAGALYSMPGAQYGGITQTGGISNPGSLPGVMPAQASATSVRITDDGFSPKTLNVTPGTTVRWKNDSRSAMTVTSDKGDWSSQEIPAGGEFTATFTQPGTFDYHCKEHKDMKGTVVAK